MGPDAPPSAFPAPADALDPDYYLHNMFLVLSFVLERDQHLFSTAEKTLFQSLMEASEGARRLFSRLYGRKGPFFRLNTLKYDEINDIPGAAEELLALGLFRTPEEGDLDDILALFTVKALRSIAKDMGIPTKGATRRQNLLSVIKETNEHSPSLMESLLSFGPCISLNQKALFDRVFRLFFLNEWLGPGTLVALDLAHIAFPSYEIRRSRPVFQSPEDLIDYESALGTLGAIDTLGELEDLTPLLTLIEALKATVEAAPPPKAGEHPYLRGFAGSAIRCKALYRAGRLLERKKRFSEAEAIFAYLISTPWLPHRRGRIWERLSVDRKHLQDKLGALEACEAALQDPTLGPDQLGDLAARGRKLRKSLGLPDNTPPKVTPWERLELSAPLLSQGPRQRALFQGPGGEAIIVERLALTHFESQGWRGTFAENGLYTTLFGRLLWDIIFAPVPDVFQTPFQVAPLDLGTPAFFQTRKDALSERLKAIAGGEMASFLERSAQHEGQACRGVIWGVWSDALLLEAAEGLGGPAVAFILETLARRHRALSRGLPDLLLWRGKGDSMVVEVKSPRDRLSKEQRAWLARLMAAGIPSAVLRVEDGPYLTSPSPGT